MIFIEPPFLPWAPLLQGFAGISWWAGGPPPQPTRLSCAAYPPGPLRLFKTRFLFVQKKPEMRFFLIVALQCCLKLRWKLLIITGGLPCPRCGGVQEEARCPCPIWIWWPTVWSPFFLWVINVLFHGVNQYSCCFLNTGSPEVASVSPLFRY